MIKLHKILNLAIEEAEKSDMCHRHGAVLFNNKHIYGIGHNRLDRSRMLEKFKMQSVHAEVDSLYSFNPKRKTKNTNILVIRLNSTGKLVYSKPCQCCFERLRKSGINKIYYSDEFGNILCERIKNIKKECLPVSSGTKFRRQ